MAEQNITKKQAEAALKEERLKAALKANMARRKAQAKTRSGANTQLSTKEKE